METDPYRGSRMGCLSLTESVAERLGKIVKPHAVVESEKAVYFPKGPKRPYEAKLGETEDLLSPENREAVTAWWLAIRPGANTPNWDIASKCAVDSRPGLILVEAKAHHGELERKGKPKDGNPTNDAHIRAAIAEANGELNAIMPDWHLSADSHYQLCDRFAWGWKVASLGVSVVLVYLGFLNVTDMPGCRVFSTHEEWTEAVHQHADRIVPHDAWGEELKVNGTPLIPLIRSWPAA
jgi:hypothetical protein